MYHDVSPINYSYWSYLHQLSYPTGAPQQVADCDPACAAVSG